MSLLDRVHSPADLKGLSLAEIDELAAEIRQFIVEAVSVTGGHLGSNLGAVELTLAIHRVFDSPRDIILWDTGHQAYAHKIVTGRADRFTARGPTPGVLRRRNAAWAQVQARSRWPLIPLAAASPPSINPLRGPHASLGPRLRSR